MIEETNSTSEENNKKGNLRKAISAKLRFEVFKRDSFKCKYCGANGESVVLHVDHLTPVVEGGKNDIMNLVTSCMSCNLGKGARELNDQSVAEKSRKQAEELQELAAQLEMMAKWRAELLNHSNNTTTRLVEYWNSLTPGLVLKESAYPEIQKLTKKYNYEKITEAMDSSVSQYMKYKDDGVCESASYNIAFDKIAGILKWQQKLKENPELEQLYYIRAIAAKRCPNYFPQWDATDLIKKALQAGVTNDDLKSAAVHCTNWTNFANRVEELIEDLKPPEPVYTTEQIGSFGEAKDNLIYCDACTKKIPLSKAVIAVTWYKKTEEQEAKGEIGFECNGCGCNEETITKQVWTEESEPYPWPNKKTVFPAAWWFGHDGFVACLSFLASENLLLKRNDMTTFLQRLYIKNFDSALLTAELPEYADKKFVYGLGYFKKNEIADLLK
jgi:hypothetical protein